MPQNYSPEHYREPIEVRDPIARGLTIFVLVLTVINFLMLAYVSWFVFRFTEAMRDIADTIGTP